MNFDHALFLREGRYPHWPVCPVKRYLEGQSFPECGIVHDGVPKVFIVNMFALPLPKSEFEKLKKYEYEYFEDMVADGWVVD